MDKYIKLKNVRDYFTTKAVLEKAETYKENLTKIINMNFDRPDDQLKEFAIKNNIDLSDTEFKTELHNYKLSYINKINKFYEETANISLSDVQVNNEQVNKFKGKKTKKKTEHIQSKELSKENIEQVDNTQSPDECNEGTIKLKKIISPKNERNSNNTGKGHKKDKQFVFQQLFYIVISIVMLIFALLFFFTYFDIK